jgi:hypothetical protein
LLPVTATRYEPLGVFTTVGSCAPVEPLTAPGFGYAGGGVPAGQAGGVVVVGGLVVVGGRVVVVGGRDVVDVVVAPVQATPLSVKTAGAGLEPFQAPLNPTVVLPPLAIVPL